MTTFSCVVALHDTTGGIGIDGQLPWLIPGDMGWFTRVTKGATIIMGKRTWQSINCKPLKDRRNIVVSRTGLDPDASKGVYVVASFAAALELASLCQHDSRIFVIGGQQLYETAVADPRCTHVYATMVTSLTDDNCQHSCFDTFFPLEPLVSDWQPEPVPDTSFEGINRCRLHPHRVSANVVCFRRAHKAVHAKTGILFSIPE